MAAEACASACRVFLNRPLFADKVRDNRRGGGVEAHHVEHTAIGRVGEGEAVGGQAHHDGLRIGHKLAAVIAQCLGGWMLPAHVSLSV